MVVSDAIDLLQKQSLKKQFFHCITRLVSEHLNQAENQIFISTTTLCHVLQSQ